MLRSHALTHHLPGLVVAVFAIASCRGTAPSNGLVQIANVSATEASFHWHSPGLLGTPLLGGSGTEPVPACEAYTRGFAPGDQRITVTSASSARAFDLVVPSSGQRLLEVVIRPDGRIEEITPPDAPASPYCAVMP